MAQDLTIGRLARAADVNVETIRYYQRRGLLDVPAKPASGRRRYSSNAVRRLRFIKRAQWLGFTLEQASLLAVPAILKAQQTLHLLPCFALHPGRDIASSSFGQLSTSLSRSVSKQ